MKRRASTAVRRAFGTIALAVTIALAYAAASGILPELTFPAFLLSALATLLNGFYHASKD
jgi:hypothetical protein